jgi:F-type H+-transporting ATPase subunit b
MKNFLVAAMVRRMTTLGLGLMLLMSAGVTVRAQAATTEATTPATSAPEKKQTVLNETDQYRMSPTVVKLGGMMGMKPEMAANVFTIFNIVVLFGAVGYGLMKMLPKAFRARSTKIQKSLVDARSATEEATARLNSVEDRLSKLDGQIAAMKTQSEADSVRDEQRIKASVEDEKAKIVAAAEAEILSATTMARREIQKYAAELAIDQAARKLVVTADTDRLLVESFASRLGAGMGSDVSGGSKN